MTYYAILVTNTWTNKQSLMPGIYSSKDADVKKSELTEKCSKTGNIKNNTYTIIELQ